jgi:heptosyltransferase-2
MRVLISRTDRIGDVILTLPVAKCLRNEKHEVFYLVSSYTAPLLHKHPDISDIILVDNKSIKNLVKELKKFNFDAVIALFPVPSLALAFYLSKIPIRIGTGYRYFSFLYNRKVFIHRKHSKRHEVFYNLEMVKPLGIEPQYYPPILYLSERERERGKKNLSGLKRPVIVVHPGSRGSADNWSLGKYKRLVKILLEEGYGVVITGRIEESKELDLPVSRNLLDLRNKTSLRELMEIISASDLFISSSTGPMHIASALGIPTISLFSSRIPINPTRWKPLHPQSRIISSFKVDEIPVEKVLSSIRELLSQTA